MNQGQGDYLLNQLKQNLQDESYYLDDEQIQLGDKQTKKILKEY